jgi:hypothetical protein
MPDELEVPPRWAIKEAVRRCGSAVAGRDLTLEEIRWTVGQEQAAEDSVRELVFAVQDEPDKLNTIPLVNVVLMGREFAMQAN